MTIRYFDEFELKKLFKHKEAENIFEILSYLQNTKICTLKDTSVVDIVNGKKYILRNEYINTSISSAYHALPKIGNRYILLEDNLIKKSLITYFFAINYNFLCCRPFWG